jgi:hypothetical protein
LLTLTFRGAVEIPGEAEWAQTQTKMRSPDPATSSRQRRKRDRADDEPAGGNDVDENTDTSNAAPPVPFFKAKRRRAKDAPLEGKQQDEAVSMEVDQEGGY